MAEHAARKYARSMWFVNRVLKNFTLVLNTYNEEFLKLTPPTLEQVHFLISGITK